MDTIRISLIIPAYNEERHLPACVAAIAAQTVAPYEVIVVDNNSTDGTVRLAQKHSFVRVIHEDKQGIVFARNAGFEAATGTIIARIDADTKLPPNWCERIQEHYALPENKKTVLTGGCYFYNLHTGRLTGRMYDLIVHRVNRWLLGYYFPWGANCALPREAWHAARGRSCLRTDIHEDLDLGIHLHEAGCKTVYTPRVRVGAVARRIMTERGKLWPYLAMWPKTFQIHGVRTFPLVWPLAIAVWLGSYGIYVSEKMFGLFAAGTKSER